MLDPSFPLYPSPSLPPATSPATDPAATFLVIDALDKTNFNYAYSSITARFLSAKFIVDGIIYTVYSTSNSLQCDCTTPQIDANHPSQRYRRVASANFFFFCCCCLCPSNYIYT